MDGPRRNGADSLNRLGGLHAVDWFDNDIVSQSDGEDGLTKESDCLIKGQNQGGRRFWFLVLVLPSSSCSSFFLFLSFFFVVVVASIGSRISLFFGRERMNEFIESWWGENSRGKITKN